LLSSIRSRVQRKLYREEGPAIRIEVNCEVLQNEKDYEITFEVAEIMEQWNAMTILKLR
jgi:hypothetical protein